MIYELYNHALDVNIKPEEFWDYTIQEISDLISSFNRVHKNKARQKVMHDYILSKMLAHQVALMFDKNGEELAFWKFAPHLFEDLREEEEEREVALQLELHKERMRAFAERFNQARKESV